MKVGGSEDKAQEVLLRIREGCSSQNCLVWGAYFGVCTDWNAQTDAVIIKRGLGVR